MKFLPRSVRPTAGEELELASRHPVLSVLEPRSLQALLASARVRRFRARRMLLREGDRADRVFCLLEGSVRVFHRTKAPKRCC